MLVWHGRKEKTVPIHKRDIDQELYRFGTPEGRTPKKS